MRTVTPSWVTWWRTVPPCRRSRRPPPRLLSGEVSKMLVALDEREREILRLRFGLDRGEPRTLDEVGEHFNLTRERIRQIEARAMSKLRHPSTDRGARELLTTLGLNGVECLLHGAGPWLRSGRARPAGLAAVRSPV